MPPQREAGRRWCAPLAAAASLAALLALLPPAALRRHGVLPHWRTVRRAQAPLLWAQSLCSDSAHARSRSRHSRAQACPRRRLATAARCWRWLPPRARSAGR
jgi:hypothetical protein